MSTRCQRGPGAWPDPLERMAPRSMPAQPFMPSGHDELRPDAIAAFGKPVVAITLDDWLLDPGALSFLTPEAWACVLPSLLAGIRSDPARAQVLAEEFTRAFDRSFGPEAWHDWFVERIAMLTADDLDALVEVFSREDWQRALSLEPDQAERCVITLMHAQERLASKMDNHISLSRNPLPLGSWIDRYE